MPPIPFIDLKRLEPDFLPRWNARCAEMSANTQFIGGAAVETLEARLQSYTGAAHAVTCANGTDALQLALRAVGVARNDTVLLPDHTFWATFEAVVNVGANPVTVDCTRSDQAIDVELVREAIRTHKPKAVMVVHLYGWGSARLAELRTLCGEAGIPLIEDGAQAFGVTYQGESLFAGAMIATTSFYPAKVLGAAGDGGAVFCRDEATAHRVRQLSNHGRASHYGHAQVGWNSRLDALQAAFLDISMEYIDARLASRRQAVAQYRERLQGRFDGFQVVDAPAGYVENGYCNVCLVEDAALKTRIEDTLKAHRIGFGNIYPAPMSAQPGAKDYIAGKIGGEQAEWICAHVLNLPAFPYLGEDEIARVAAAVEEACAAPSGQRKTA